MSQCNPIHGEELINGVWGQKRKRYSLTADINSICVERQPVRWETIQHEKLPGDIIHLYVNVDMGSFQTA